ncbi:MAG: UDP-N-acetylglucosamine 1-carboxyvinyltransferase [Clostridia bacterium]|nr:UDP-N-acetylglucosamine 1-carboxyvinyltransferase [Clostridia bacterium]
MEKIIIHGGKPLTGEIAVSGMKNAAVAIVLASVMTEDKCVIENLPRISDVDISLELLRARGVRVKFLNRTTVEIDSTVMDSELYGEDDLARKMRASYYLVGALLARFGKARVGCPGGCDFGARPIDQHIKGFEALGADVVMEPDVINASASDGLKGASVYMDVVSVGATINVMLAAVKADGVTVIENAAHEPHVVDTANFLNACGADISGAGTDTIKIKGVKQLHGVTYAIIPDMIEAGTFLILGAATGGRLKISNVIPKHLDSITAKLEEMGATIEQDDEAVTVSTTGPLSRVNIKTQPYPGFPTDMNPQMCVLMSLAQGVSTLTEGVWENRFRYVEELKRMGAKIKVEGRTATVEGVGALNAAQVRALDLRAGAAMIVAGLAAEGRTEIDEVHHIQRGYEDIIHKLESVGADIRMVSIPDNLFDKAN